MFGKEPALILGFISAGIILAVGFGLKVSGEQINNIMLFAAATIALFGGVATRSQVIPTEKANAQILTATRMPEGTTVQQVIAKQERESK